MVISMERWKGKVAVVTGASAGIGAAIAVQLVDAGLTSSAINTISSAKQRWVIAKTLQGKSGKLLPLKGDVSKEDDVLQAFKWVKENVGPVYILINNAGAVKGKDLLDGDTKEWKEIYDTNVLGLCVATREAINDMRANNVDGHIVHINSVTGHYVPNIGNLNVEPSSKYAVTALTETLRQELNSIGSKIKITSVSPGAVQTEMAQAAVLISPQMQEYLKTAPFLQAGDIADAVCYALATPPHVQIHELMIKPVGEPV